MTIKCKSNNNKTHKLQVCKGENNTMPATINQELKKHFYRKKLMMLQNLKKKSVVLVWSESMLFQMRKRVLMLKIKRKRIMVIKLNKPLTLMK